MISLTRRYRFAASHRLHVRALNDAENVALFGKCNNPFGHGHDYALSVTVAGVIDETTGLIFSTGLLDRMVEVEVLRLFAHRNFNADVPHFADLVPTTENLALVIAGILIDRWTAWFERDTGACIERIHLQETERNGFELALPEQSSKLSILRKQEGNTVHA